MMTLQGYPPIVILSLRMTHILGYHVNHPSEIRKNVSFPSKLSIIKKGPFATCLNALTIKVTLTTIPNLLCHEARLVVLFGPC
jgi:hypothetical protein